MESTLWRRPKTTRRYLNPPKAERIYTLWAEGKIVFGEVIRGIDWRSYGKLTCSGMWFVYGNDNTAFDFRTAKNRVETDGTPIHGLEYRLGNLRICLESFCDTSRQSTAFVRMKVHNEGMDCEEEKISVLLRSGNEKKLVFGAPDEYESYNPDVNVWKDTPVSWHRVNQEEGMVIVDEHNFMTVHSDIPHVWMESEGRMEFQVSLPSGQSAEAVFSFGKGHASWFDYEQEKESVKLFWSREMARITNLPDHIRNHPETLSMVRHLVTQILQCFCYPVGEDILMLRQGGLQRLIWPWEASFALEALGKIGDFSDYIEPVISMYFDTLQAPNGEIKPEGENWANITASVLYSFSRYCMDCNKRFFYCYREHAKAAYEWIKKMRASSVDSENSVSGLFPPMRSCDWFQVFQAWGITDLYNYNAVRTFGEVSCQFDDKFGLEVKAEAEDYRATIAKYFHKFEREAEQCDELRIPLCPDGNDEKLLTRFLHSKAGYFAQLGFVKEKDVHKVLNWMKKMNIRSDKFYLSMDITDENCHYWYTTTAEFNWFYVFKHMGRVDKCKEIVDTMIQYSMTGEYYMIERYMDNDPYFVPWSPNVSANGRMLMMLIDDVLTN